MKHFLHIAGILAVQVSFQALCAPAGSGRAETAPSYPKAHTVPVSDLHAGVDLKDPYRWLENDLRDDQQVADWVKAQRGTTAAYLDTLPGREAFRASLSKANRYVRVGAPQKKGTHYFYTRKDGEQDQAALMVREGENGKDRLLLDPTTRSDDASVALAEWAPSKDGKRLAYAVQDGGSDWRKIGVLDVATGRPLNDEVKWARFTQIAWAQDGSGFYYSRYPEPKGRSEDGSGLANHAVYFHRIGTNQAQDALFYSTPQQAGHMNSLGMTSDGRYAIAYSSADLVHADITVIDLNSQDRTQRKLIDNPRFRWSVIGNVGTKLYLLTDDNAERGKIVSVDLAAPEAVYQELLAQQDAIMSAASIVGDRLMVSYLVDAKSEVRRYTLEGNPDGVVKLPGIGSVSALTGDAGDNEAFFSFASFNQPNTVYRYDASTNAQQVWIEPEIEVDLGQIVVKQVFYASKDGTRIPMFLVRRKDISGPAPTVLMAYGAFAISTPPAYSAMLTGWLLQGGALAIPNIRGGGEYGAMWHEAGRREKKQNGIDDVIAAAEYLHSNKLVSKGGLTAYGASAGGLLIGAVINQRPELFGAALPAVGVMDMLRYHKFTGGQLWVGEYGDPAVTADFKTLLSYSPYHNIQAGRNYPAILATTAEADDRVVPAHSFKYVAALQAADLGPKPRLLRIDTRAGHGAGKSTTKMIDEAVDMWAFSAYWTKLNVEADP